MDLIGKFCYVKAAIKIESIFIGAKIALQVKVYEAEVRMIESGTKRLLPRSALPQADTVVSIAPKFSMASITQPNPASALEDDDHIHDSDNEEDDGQQAILQPSGAQKHPISAPILETVPRKAIRTISKKK